MDKLHSISLTTICKWATNHLLPLYAKSVFFFFFSFFNCLSLTRGQKGSPSAHSPSAHLANTRVWNMAVIQQSWQLREKRRATGSAPDVFITVVSNHRRQRLRRQPETWRWINLSVWRSTQVKRCPDPPDLQVQLDNSIYSLCPWQRHSWQTERGK